MGPTAAGKTLVAEAIAARLGGVLINADAFQVYRGFDIGTAKPSARQNYRLLDILEPFEPFSVGQWVRLAVDELQVLHARRTPAVVVGGSGLYARALFEGYTDLAPPADPGLRSALEARVATEGLQDLVRELEWVAPDVASRIDLRNPVRVRRALERALTPFAPSAVELPPFRKLKLALWPEQASHEAWIESRIEWMFRMGWLDEVEGLIAGGLTREMPASRAIGYRTLMDVAHGVMSIEGTASKIATETRQYAKRQRTWLRTEPNRCDVSGFRSAEAATEESLRLIELNHF